MILTVNSDYFVKQLQPVDPSNCQVWCLMPPSWMPWLIALLMTANNSETSVNFYHTTYWTVVETSHLHTCRRENLKSHVKQLISHMRHTMWNTFQLKYRNSYFLKTFLFFIGFAPVRRQWRVTFCKGELLFTSIFYIMIHLREPKAYFSEILNCYWRSSRRRYSLHCSVTM
jgi:hypothetical protein